MGLWSYTCPHCTHSILIERRTSLGINDWMGVAVVLQANSEPFLVAEYEGYGIGDDVEEFVIIHEACWEVAGKPPFSSYSETARWAADQGFFFDREDHDLIDPRITNPEERARLLVEGRASRERRIYTQLASDANQMVSTPREHWDDDDERAQPWRRRYRVGTNTHRDGAGTLVDRLTDERIKMEGSIEQLEAEAASRWSQWIESAELKALLAHHRTVQDALLVQHVERLKVEGRYSVECRRILGDQILGGLHLKRDAYAIVDQILYEDVGVITQPYEAFEEMAFSDDPRQMPHSGWAERSKQLSAAAEQSRLMAQEVAGLLNSEWAAEGHPVPWERIRELERA